MSLTDRGRSLLSTLAAGLIWSVPQYFYERPLEPASEDRQAPPPEGVTFELIDQANVGRIRDWRGPGEVWHFQRLLNRGDIGIYALADGEVIHYGWAAPKLPGHMLAHAHDPIEVGDVLFHRGYTREGYRRRGVGAHAIVCLLASLHERFHHQGLRRACALVRTDRPGPQHLLAGLGFQKRQQLHTVRLLGTWFIYWSRDIPPDGATGPVSPARVRVRLKVPEILWDPRVPIVHTLFGRDRDRHG